MNSYIQSFTKEFWANNRFIPSLHHLPDSIYPWSNFTKLSLDRRYSVDDICGLEHWNNDFPVLTDFKIVYVQYATSLPLKQRRTPIVIPLLFIWKMFRGIYSLFPPVYISVPIRYFYGIEPFSFLPFYKCMKKFPFR